MSESSDVTRGFQPRDCRPEEAEPQLERIVGTVLRVGVVASSACLAVGLGLWFVDASGLLASLLLQVGVLVLLATPIARVAASIVGFVAERDWLFVTLTTIVLVELMASVVAALVFSRRL